VSDLHNLLDRLDRAAALTPSPLMRVRQAGLALRDADQELTDAIRAAWYTRETVTDIAIAAGFTRATIYARLRKAEEQHKARKLQAKEEL